MLEAWERESRGLWRMWGIVEPYYGRWGMLEVCEVIWGLVEGLVEASKYGWKQEVTGGSCWGHIVAGGS